MATNAFTAVGLGTVVEVSKGRSASYALTGTFVGTVVVDVSSNGSSGWTAWKTSTAADTGTYVNSTTSNLFLRSKCSAYTSGTATAAVTVATNDASGLHFDGNKIVDGDGQTQATFLDDSVTLPGALRVATLNGDVTMAGTLTAGSATEYGFVHATGLYDDLVVNMIGLNPPGGASDPDINTTTGIPMFDKASTEVMAFAAQIPHTWKSGGTSALHVHCMADQATDPATSPAEEQTDGVFTLATRNFNSEAGTFTGMEGQYVTVTGTGTGQSAVLGSYQIVTVTDANNVILEDTAAVAALADDGEVAIAYSVYLDTVRLSINYKVIPVNGTWDQASATTVATTGRLPIHDTDAVQALIPIADIDLAAFQDSAIIVGRISRIGGNGEDKYDDDLHVLSADFHIKKNTLGSLAENGEDF